MISLRPNTTGHRLLSAICRYPGEYSDRQIRYGKIVIADVPNEVQNRPSRWVAKLREQGVVAPALVRLGWHVEARHIERTEGQARTVLDLLAAHPEGIEAEELARRVSGQSEASGSLKETLADLYRAGLASPPAALWATEKGREMVNAALL